MHMCSVKYVWISVNMERIVVNAWSISQNFAIINIVCGKGMENLDIHNFKYGNHRISLNTTIKQWAQ